MGQSYADASEYFTYFRTFKCKNLQIFLYFSKISLHSNNFMEVTENMLVRLSY